MINISNNFEINDSNKPLVFGLFEDMTDVNIDININKDISELIKDKTIKLSLGKLNKIHTLNKITNKIIYIIGLGKIEEYSYERLEESLRDINYKLDNELNINLKSFCGKLDIKEVTKIIVQTICFYNYKYDECLTKKIDNDLMLKLISDQDIKSEIIESFYISTAIDNTRDLVNKPYNYLSANDLANYALNLVKSFNNNKVSIKILEENEIATLGMNAFLGVNKGSSSEPKLIHIKYQNSDTPPIGIVGKGLMYDTGGYSLKSSMNNMKCDMAGSATVLGILEAAVKNELKVNIQVIICATDNRIDGNALLPDDVLTAMNKKTIEIISTDAEGRLTLADGVCYAQQEGCKEIIDIATLTGSVVVALGEYTTGLFGNNQTKLDKMIEASKYANEEMWVLPINEHIRKQVRSSKVADIKNSTGRAMGASSAAAFIEEFIEKGIKWMHLDIAGTAFHTSPSNKEFYGATGATVKTVYHYLKKLSH